jgi:hypothetical protein
MTELRAKFLPPSYEINMKMEATIPSGVGA